MPLQVKPVLSRGVTSKRMMRERIRELLPWYTILGAAIDMCCWFLLFTLMVLQIVNAIMPLSKTNIALEFGSRPMAIPIGLIPGNSDDAYIDRAMTCVLHGRVFKSATLEEALKGGSLVKHPYRTVDSYTVLTRPDPQTTINDVYRTYDAVCAAIAVAIDGIAYACADQGYKPTTNTLKVNIGIDATYTTEVTNALPILILPYWDNAGIGRYVVPGQDGVACSIKLYNQFVGQGTFYQINVINRADYDRQTRFYLNEPAGTWKHGWYEFPDGKTKYYSHMANDLRAKDLPGGLGIASAVYDALAKQEIDCQADKSQCQNQVSMEWDGVLSQNSTELWSECVCIQDHQRNGMLWYAVDNEYVLSNNFGWGAVLANVSVFSLLSRWGLAFLALWRGYMNKTSDWHGCGIGITSCSDTFVWLPILLLPNFKQLFLCFWASSIQFEGDLVVVCDAWYIMYPMIAQLVLLQFGIYNWIAKTLRLRMSDRLFGPVLVAFCLGHYYRLTTFDKYGTAMGFSGRTQTKFFVASYRDATMIQVIFTQALLIGGNVKPIFYAKLILLCLPMIDLIFFSDRVGSSCKYQPPNEKACQFEFTIAVYANRCGGLGKSPMYSKRGLVGYEVVRLGYLLFGKDNIMSFTNYYVAIACYPSSLINETFNQRILVFDVVPHAIRMEQTMYRWNHPRFAPCWWFQIQSMDLE